MIKIETLNKIAPCGTDLFDSDKYTVENVDKIGTPEAILLRSASMHDMTFNPELLCIGRAGAGTNNIPVDKCSEQGIVVFNTPGANANGVKELAITGLLLSNRKITAAIDECKTLKGKGDEVPKLVEKIKGAYGGPELLGKKLGVIGLGAIGALVANAAAALKMEVCGYDPYLSVGGALSLSRKFNYVKDLREIYENCDYISLNAPVTDATRGMINAESLAQCKDGVRIVNFARSELVDNAALIAALESGKVASYVTDFPTDDLIGVEGVIAIPHLGASTPESEDNCAIMAVNQVIDYIENGNIKNSVNLPNLSMNKTGDFKLCVIHKNEGGMIEQITTAISSSNGNIENMESRSKKDYAYSVLDISGKCDGFADKIKAIDKVVSVRII
ncbi:MAG: 3-phosphoglycerate dehydrogenase family protein [Oscillospiraceae bacterium]|nr:3-phosphoglycerate dehydrogenase family protein [Oscillospiraceae bacterium]